METPHPELFCDPAGDPPGLLAGCISAQPSVCAGDLHHDLRHGAVQHGAGAVLVLAGLGTLNNRIYFGLYCTLFLSAVLCLLLGFLLRGRSLRCRLAVQYGGVLFFLLWHVCLNAYDLFRDPQAEIGLYYTAVLGLSVFILMPAAPALLMHGSAYALLMALSGRILSGGDRSTSPAQPLWRLRCPSPMPITMPPSSPSVWRSAG